ncbi:MAG: Gfo/Idh/MocA family oxidoreductase, partial [Verrucomicrobiota bacterium]
MNHPSRRRFLKGSLATAGLAATSLPANAQSSGANTDLRVAVVGCGGKGKGHLKSLLGAEGVRVAGVCDVDRGHLDEVIERTKKAGQKGLPPKGYLDYRELVEDPDIDSIIIATPNHLHTTIAVRAIAAGKHVYVEKPVSHNIWEGRKLIEAAQFASGKGLIVQHGMQRRSDTGWHEAMEWLADKDCPIGKVTLSRGLCYKGRQSIGKVDGPQQPPEGVDYDLWSGPREMLPIRRERFHYDWHWQWPYGNGDIGNQGPHQMDVARWPLTNTTVAPRVISIGGRFGYDDDGTTANTQIAYFDFTPAPLIFEVCGLPNSGLDWKKGMPA